MSTRTFDRIYTLDKKTRTKEEEKEFRRYLNLLRTYNLIEIYNDYVLNKKREER